MHSINNHLRYRLTIMDLHDVQCIKILDQYLSWLHWRL